MTSSAQDKPAVSDLRLEYDRPPLRRNDLDQDAVEQFRQWLAEAMATDIIEPHAMTLATATAAGIPSARTVLLRGYDERGFVFYTNYNSQKGRELTENPQAAITFYWAPLHRQIRIVGPVSCVSSKESDAYFQSRPEGSKIGAWASAQSQVLSNRSELEAKIKEVEANFQGKKILRPSYWGGFRLSPTVVEFWQGRPNRLHDRWRYQRQGDSSWLIERLAP